MRVLIDTNVVLDVLLGRGAHAPASTAVLAAVENHEVTGLLGATSITTIHYLATKAIGARRARRHVETLLSICDVAQVDAAVLRDALSVGFLDFEDGVLHEAARRAKATAIVTRDKTGFRRATLAVYSPEELLGVLDLR